MPKKMRQKALKMALTLKAKEEKLIIVDNISSLKKTKQAADLIGKISAKEKNVKDLSRFTFVLSEKNKNARLAFRNLANSDVIAFKDLNALKVYLGGVLVLDKDAFGEKKEIKKDVEDEKKDKVGAKKKVVKKTTVKKATKKSKK